MTQRFPLFVLTLVTTALLSAGCGGAASNNANGSANSTTSPNANTASNSNTNGNSIAVSSLPPMVTDIDSLQLAATFGEASDTPGRIIKVTGNLAIANDERLIIGYGNSDTVAGNSITCKGDFAKYSGLEDKIKGLAKQNKAPRVVIEGKFASYEDDTITLEPCVMTEIPK